jgi:hypothetical protein
MEPKKISYSILYAIARDYGCHCPARRGVRIQVQVVWVPPPPLSHLGELKPETLYVCVTVRPVA